MSDPTKKYEVVHASPRSSGCACAGSGIVLTGSLFERGGLTIEACTCATDGVSTRRELVSLQRRWDALVEDACVDAAVAEIVDVPFGDHPFGQVGREEVGRALHAARETALNVDELDSTSYLDSAAQKRIAELEQLLADMQVGRGRLAAILQQGHHGDRGRPREERCCNPECKGEWGTGCYCCHHPKFALSSHDHDAAGAYVCAEKERSRG